MQQAALSVRAKAAIVALVGSVAAVYASQWITLPPFTSLHTTELLTKPGPEGIAEAACTVERDGEIYFVSCGGFY